MMGDRGSEKSLNCTGMHRLHSPPPQSPAVCVCICLSGPRVGLVHAWAGTPQGGPACAWGPDVSVSAPKPVPGSSVAHLRSTRCSCLQLQAQKPLHGPPSCPLHGLALSGSPPVLHSKGGNKPGAGECEELRVRAPWAGMLPPGPPTPSTLDSAVFLGPKPSILPLILPHSCFKSPLLSHTKTKEGHIHSTHPHPHGSVSINTHRHV